MKPEKLIYRVQNYEWGRLGKNSIVASLKQAADHDFAIEENKPYAEVSFLIIFSVVLMVSLERKRE